jgi:hypothetical protein
MFRELTMVQRSRRFMRLMLAAVVLAGAWPAAADHYPNVPNSVERKDRAALNSLRRLTYAESYEQTLVLNECNCLEPTCDGGTFMVSCGGEIEPFYAGWLTATRRTSRETCLVCACAVLGDLNLRATPVCAGL